MSANELNDHVLDTPLPASSHGGASPMALFQALRPRQWVKNVVLLAGILFTLDRHHAASDWLRVLAGVAIFCGLSSAIYLVNDVCDREQDRKHPLKQHRAIASGRVGVPAALLMAVVLGVLGLAASAMLGPWFALATFGYAALTISYSLWLKHLVLLDAMALAGCYVIRAAAGAVVIGVMISPWLMVCTTLGALLIGLSKRRNEILTLEDAAGHRRILEEYTVPMLDQMIGVITGATLVAYLMYTIQSATARQRPLMVLTIPFVVYGVLRYFYLVHRHGKGGDPSSELLEDRGLVVCGVLWAITCGVVMLLPR